MADFKIPTVGKAFPVFCQRIIPLTFDNSLSYLEFLGHMNAKLNEVICALNEEGVAIQELAQLVDSTLDSFKAEIQELINANKEEIMQAIDDLRTDLQGEISDLQDDVLIIKDELRLINSQITDIIRTKGNISIFSEIENSIDYTMSLTSANCDIYYKTPNSDIWHELDTDTTLAEWAAGTTSEAIGSNDFLFMFHGPEGYPEEQFIFPSGSALSLTAAEAEGNAVKLYSRATIPGEDFNSGLVLYADAEITSSSGTSTAALTTTESIPDINCLYLSNSFALAQLDPVTYTLSLTVPEIFGQLYNQETGNNVFPRVKINSTLAYDSNGVMGVSSEIVNGALNEPEDRAKLVDIVNNGFKNALDLNSATNVIASSGISYTLAAGILTVTWENLTQGRTLKFKNIPHIEGTYILTGAQTLTDPSYMRADLRQGADASDIIVQDYGQASPEPFTFQAGVFDYVIRIAPESGETSTSGTATFKPMICSVPDYNISPLFEEYKEKITMLQLTQAEYDLIVDPDPHTLYIIVG